LTREFLKVSTATLELQKSNLGLNQIRRWFLRGTDVTESVDT